MKNLFDFATKELSHDAFLRWLFENWQEPECDIIVRKLLKEFCNFDDEIQDIKTKAQDHNIDISVEIYSKFNKDKIVRLFIENKTFSNEHNQLTKYDEYINTLSNTHKVFYKINKINVNDYKGIEKANEENIKTNKSLWQAWDIHKIVKLFECKSDFENLILKHYVEHIRKIQEYVQNTKKPISNDNNKDLLQWEAYFKNSIIPSLQEKEYICDAWKAGQYPYICLVLTKKGYKGRKIPYLEIRSRDCLNNNFIARVLCYDVSVEDFIKNLSKLEENVKKQGFSCKGIVRKRKGKEIFPKQIGYTENLTAISDDDFIKLVDIWGEKYLNAMKDWC